MSLVPTVHLQHANKVISRSEFTTPTFSSADQSNPTQRYFFSSLGQHDDKKGEPEAPTRTKIVCTVGPATQSPEMLAKLLDAGMNVVRMNFSHGTHDFHRATIQNLRSVLRRTKKLCAIMLDTKGPEIRTGKLVDGKEVELYRGQDFVLTTETTLGDAAHVTVQYPNLPKVLSPGDSVLIDDGLISMTVHDITDNEVHCVVENAGTLGENKGVNLPNVQVDLPALTQKDVEDIQFGIAQGIDYIAASFVRKASDVRAIRELLGVQGRGIKILAKIENQEGLTNFDEIVHESDGIMVARGDLGVEIPIEHVCLAQKMMIRKCNLVGKCVITATQMLESMIKNPSPTRAEATDVANAVFDGTDCVMLSGETAKGLYPVEAVQMMKAICREAELALDYSALFNSLRQDVAHEHISITEAIASSAVKTAFDLKAALIICLTESGTSARLIAKYRPFANILAITSTEQTARQCLGYRGVTPLLVGSMMGTDSLILRAIATAKSMGMCRVGDLVIVVHGLTEGVSGATNNLRVLTVSY